jgi:hypothetical protein
MHMLLILDLCDMTGENYFRKNKFQIRDARGLCSTVKQFESRVPQIWYFVAFKAATGFEIV